MMDQVEGIVKSGKAERTPPDCRYEYTYTLHASLPGEYKVIPTTAQQFYFPEVNGWGDGTVFTANP